MLISRLNYTWLWCKVHWKFLLGISIPIIISIIMRKGNQNKIFTKALEIRNKELEIKNIASENELNIKIENQKDHNRNVESILDFHQSNLEKIKEKELDNISNINSADQATVAIKEKLGEK